MAYQYNPNLTDDENERLKQEQAGQGGVITGVSTTPPSPVQPAGSGFTNLQTYLDANRAQSGQVAERVAGQLEKQAGETRGGIETLGQTTQAAIEAGTVRPDTELVQSALKNPTQFVQTPANVQKFTKQRTASYTGPAGVESQPQYGDVLSAVSKAKTTKESIGTESGRLDLVRQTMAQPGAGKVALNQFLMQGDPTAAERIQAVGPQFSGIEDYLAQVSGQAREAAGAGRTATDAARTGVQEGLYGDAGVIPALESSVSGRVSTAETERNRINSLIKSVRAKLSLGQPLTPSEYTMLGMYPAQNAALERGVSDIGNFYPGEVQASVPDLSYYLSGGRIGEQPATAETVSSADDFAREAALEQLAGTDLSILRNDLSSQAGTYQGANIPSYDINQALRRLEGAVSEYDRLYNDLVSRGLIDVSTSGGGLLNNQAKWWQDRQAKGYSLEPTVPIPGTPPTPPPDEMHNLPIIDADGNIVGWIGRRGPVRGGA